MVHELRFLVPYEVWRYEGAFARWLERREVTGFFWEVDTYDGYVVVELIG